MSNEDIIGPLSEELRSELDRRRSTDAALVAGYVRCPPSKSDDAAATASLVEAIVEEPW
jgi:hypothetical protein